MECVSSIPFQTRSDRALVILLNAIFNMGTHPEHPALNRKPTKIRRKYQGLRFAVLCWTISSAVVLVLNLILGVWAVSQGNWGKDWQPILYQGRCDTVSKLSTISYLFINAMSTILLCGSSYCIQCLSAPTREELDRAHAKHSWLDVGVLSYRNLKAISKSRKVRFLLLGVSTIPLHLFYNSVIFTSIGTNLYYPFLIHDSFLDLGVSEEIEVGLHGSYSLSPDAHGNSTADLAEIGRMRDLYTDGKLDDLYPQECLKTYATQFQIKGNLFLASTNPRYPPNYVSTLGGPWATQDWMCGSMRCDKSSKWSKKNLEWKFGHTGYSSVTYCLSERQLKRCKVQFSLPLAGSVIIASTVKLGCMLSMLYKSGLWAEWSPIMSIGDLIASYMIRPDEHTKNRCLVSIDELRESTVSRIWYNKPRKHAEVCRYRFRAASRTRWLLYLLLYLSVISFVVWLFVSGLKATTKEILTASEGPTGFKLIQSLGFGKVDTRTTLRIPSTKLITNAIIANAPQVILSWIYFSCNGLLTLRSLAREWELYTLQRKGLKVSSGRERKQRSTYFLQLPYRIAIPFTVLSAFIHWLVSQSLFLVSVQLHGSDAAKGSWEMLADNP
ncbi:hypothetical protein P171DRAFT_425130, partial [Karstenula rhodostoma CBS 690.94]